MIRSLRRKFVFGAILSLSILIALLIGGISLTGYVQMERRGEEFLHMMLEEPAPPPPPTGSMRSAFGYALPERSMPAGYCILKTDQEGQLLDVVRGEKDLSGHCAKASCCLSVSAAQPAVARSSSRLSRALSKGSPSAVPCTSISRPSPVDTTFMSTSAVESSA